MPGRAERGLLRRGVIPATERFARFLQRSTASDNRPPGVGPMQVFLPAGG
jgi:hypothetical protein